RGAVACPATIRAPRATSRPGGNARRWPFVSMAILRSATWFGLVVGLLELGLVLALKRLRDPSPGFFRMNRHVVWMIPTADLVLFVGIGLSLAVVARFRPRLAVQIAAPLLGFLALLTVLLAYRPLSVFACLFLAGGLVYRFSRRIGWNEQRFQIVVRR